MSESTSSTPDAEGFRAAFAVPGEDDVEGHRASVQPGEESDQESILARSALDSDEDDVEGHQKLVP